ncbi:MAG TPA: hypothetical protein VJW20_20920 [Candidatus Angelobacter sp.]|nr:hypothetical protein [Candidatus Angelobacter sp.]
MPDHLDSTKLMPFKRRRKNGYHLPGLAKEEEEQVIDEVDPELRPEEQGYVRHFLSYADVLLKNAVVEDDEVCAVAEDDEVEGDGANTFGSATTTDRDNVTEMPSRNGSGTKDHAA